MKARRVQKIECGFTLIEVVITLGILTTMMIAVTTLLRSSFEVRFALADDAKVTHRLNVAIQKISEDLTHAFIISSKDTKRNYSSSDRGSKTIFRIDKVIGAGDKLAITTMDHRAIKYNAREGDAAYVVYELQEAKEASGRKHLYRGATGKIPSDFKEDPPMVLLASHIKSMTFEYWNGDSWSKDKWSSDRSDTKDLMPHMVKITVEAWTHDPPEDGSPADEASDEAISYSTIVHLPYAQSMKELKTKPTTPKI